MNYVLFTSCILLAISNILLIARTFHICLLIKYLVNRIVSGAGASSHCNFSPFLFLIIFFLYSLAGILRLPARFYYIKERV